MFFTSIPCYVYGVVVAQNPLSIFVAYLLISYELLQRPFLFVYLLVSVVYGVFFFFFFYISLLRFYVSCLSFFFLIPFSHYSNDNNLSISATFRCILKSHDESFYFLILFFSCFWLHTFLSILQFEMKVYFNISK